MATSHPTPVVPIFVVCGSTGTGKTKLGVEIARLVGGEVINADSVQMYRGLDIATNKATAEEMAGVPHHLLSFLEPSEDEYTVHKFQAAALDLVAALAAEGKPPVLVGGTHYYLEAVMYHFLSAAACPLPHDLPRDTDALFRLLHRLKPTAAAQVDPRDRRKLLTRLQAGEEARQEGQRFPERVLLLWADSESHALSRRLRQRVDAMVAAGLLTELQEMFRRVQEQQEQEEEEEERWKRGVCAAIGMKEFVPWLQESDPEKRAALLPACVERLKLATVRYATRQRKWVRNRLLARPPGLAIPVFRLDTTEPERWPEQVSRPLQLIIDFWRARADSGLVGRPPGGLEWWADCPVRPEPARSKAPVTYGRWRCEACQMDLFVEEQWTEHLRSRRHKKRLAGLAKRRRREEGAE